MEDSNSENRDQTPPARPLACPVCGRSFPSEVKLCPDDQVELTLTGSSSLVGTVLDGQYKIEAELLSGSLGTVYRARHTLMGRAVTVKVIHSWLCADERALARLSQEAN